MTIEVSELSDKFNNIYKKDLWGNGSGSGSSLKVTRGYRKFLAKFFKKRKIKSVVDFGCGDWQFSKTINWSGIDYKGFDVADYVLEHNRQNYQVEGVEFYKTPEDLSELPEADLIICKDVLQHLPNDYIFKFIKILSKYKYALITNDGFKHPSRNCDIVPGDWRCLDIRRAPFRVLAKKVYTRPGDLHIDFVLRGLKTPRCQWYFTERKYTLLWENPRR